MFAFILTAMVGASIAWNIAPEARPVIDMGMSGLLAFLCFKAGAFVDYCLYRLEHRGEWYPL